MTPNLGMTVKFLQDFRPGGPWVLSAIEVDRKGMYSDTVTDEAGVRQWCEKYASCNLYFSVNPVIAAVTKKAARADIKELAYLHVDVDPRVGVDLAAEKSRILKTLSNPPAGIPTPSFIVASGGGYQGFWRLAQPLPINGEPAKYEDAKLYNLALEMAFGADHCHNVDRVMRLPGTVNWPDSKKRAKGRTVCLAEVVLSSPQTVYPISRFTPAPAIATDASAGPMGSATKKAAPATPGKRLQSVDELPSSVPDLCKVVAVQGNDPDNPTKFPSRSEALFYVCCELVRAGCPEGMIFSLITDPNFRISESVLEKGAGATSYAMRQIERAQEQGINPALLELNEQHVVIEDIGGKCRVVSEVYDHALDRPRLSFQSFADFKNRYCNRLVVIGQDKDGNDKYMPLGNWWLSHPKRRQFKTIVFAPGRHIDDAFNLWRGFTVEPRAGDCSLFLNHLLNNVCRGVEEHYKFLVAWMASAVQRPDRPGYSAVVLRGPTGVGKSIIPKIFGSLFGRHFLPVTDPKHLVGSFNAHLRDCVVLFGDEAFYAGDKKHESVLKMLITEETLAIEAKGFDVEAYPNCVHLIMASNESWVVPAAADDRRFFVLDVGKEHQEDFAYFGAMEKQMDEGGLGALLHHLMNYDLSQINLRKIPQTGALQEQKIYSLDPLSEWWYIKLQNGRTHAHGLGWELKVSSDALYEDYIVHAQRVGIHRKLTEVPFKKLLERLLPPGWPKKFQSRESISIVSPNGFTRIVERPYMLEMPSLDECRHHWDTLHRIKTAWEDPEENPNLKVAF